MIVADNLMQGVMGDMLHRWQATGAQDIIGKIIGIFFPVTAFVALSFSHVIANMFLVSSAAQQIYTTSGSQPVRPLPELAEVQPLAAMPAEAYHICLQRLPFGSQIITPLQPPQCPAISSGCCIA